MKKRYVYQINNSGPVYSSAMKCYNVLLNTAKQMGYTEHNFFPQKEKLTQNGIMTIYPYGYITKIEIL